MDNIVKAVFIIYALLNIHRILYDMRITSWSKLGLYIDKLDRVIHNTAYTMWLYVVVHEFSHLIVGVLTLKGVREMSVLHSEVNGNEYAGYYMPKYVSPIKVWFINFGDALTSIAGPILPVFVLKGLVEYNNVEDLHIIIYTLVFSLVVLVIYSKDRIFSLMLIIISVGIYKLGSLDVMVNILELWLIVGLLDGIRVLSTYDGEDSDMANFTYSLLRFNNKWVSYILNKGVQLLYIYYLVDIVF